MFNVSTSYKLTELEHLSSQLKKKKKKKKRIDFITSLIRDLMKAVAVRREDGCQ